MSDAVQREIERAMKVDRAMAIIAAYTSGPDAAALSDEMAHMGVRYGYDVSELVVRAAELMMDGHNAGYAGGLEPLNLMELRAWLFILRARAVQGPAGGREALYDPFLLGAALEAVSRGWRPPAWRRAR